MQLIAHQTAARLLSPKPPRASDRNITYAMAMTDLGRVLVARSDAGICAILFGDSGDDLAADLKTRFSDTPLKADNAALHSELSQVLNFIGAPSDKLDFAVDMRGTPFQCRVWTALRAIPVGVTITYAELAKRIGAPRAVRAVAGACAANPVALAIPCHRVVRSDGGLAGYRWGLERKRALRDREAKR